MTQTRTRTRRPVVEMTGVVADLQSQDYVDTLGGNGYRLTRVGALVHSIEQRDDTFSDEQMWRLVDLGISGKRAARAAHTPAHARINFIGEQGTIALLADVPVTFRRFTD